MTGTESCPRCGAQYPKGRLRACPRCLLDEQVEPAVIGDALELQGILGRGGMGTVYKARHLRLGRTVAVKFLPEELAQEAEFRVRFEREARALALLNHPNIVGVHDIGQDGGLSYIVMEYVEGGPLSRRMPLPLARALEVAVQVCDALAYAHAQGVVHRDVKPENILLDASGRAKVSDFGIARIIRPDERGWTVTGKGQAVGTPHYLAPEALAGAAPDPRADIYALGVVLYEMVLGRLPVGDFERAPEPIDRIVRRALAPDPAKRYATAGEMRRELEEAWKLVTDRARAATGEIKAAPGTPVTPPPPLPSPLRGEGEGGGAAGLPPDERIWIRVVAILQAISTAVALWAFLKCVKPRALSPDEDMPLIMVGVEKLPDGRTWSQARFETLWILAALGTLALALTGYALLRAHWRRAGLEVVRPDEPVAEARWVLGAGLLSPVVWAFHRLLDGQGHEKLTVYFPLLGGFILCTTLFFFWVTVLSAWRIARPLRREPLMWLGFALAPVPPAVELVLYVLRSKP